MIDKICREEINSFLFFELNIIKAFTNYKQGLVYFDVTVYHDEHFKG